MLQVQWLHVSVALATIIRPTFTERAPEFSRRIFEKFSNIKFQENPSRENQIVQCGQTDGRTDMTKLIVAFLKFAKAPINQGRKTPAEWKHNTMHCLLNVFQQIREGRSQLWSAGGCTNVDKRRQATILTEQQSCERYVKL